MWMRGLLGVARSLRTASCQPVCSRWAVSVSPLYARWLTACPQRVPSSPTRTAFLGTSRVRFSPTYFPSELLTALHVPRPTTVFVRFYAADSWRPTKSLFADSKVTSPFEDPSRTRKGFKLRSKTAGGESGSAKSANFALKDDGAHAKDPQTKNSTEEDVSKPPPQDASGAKEKINESANEAKESSAEATNVSKTEGGTTEHDSEPGMQGASMLGGSAASKPPPKKGFWKKVHAKLGTEIDENVSDAEKRRQKMARNTKLGSIFLFGYLFIGFIVFCIYYGRPKRDSEGNVIKDEYSNSLLAPFYRIIQSFRSWREYVTEPSRELLLPDPLPHPYIQPKYTLVMEMRNVLISPEWTYKTGHRFVKRPALDYFLDIVGYPNFEVVIYTSESSFTGDPVIESFDPKHRIMYKLYRDCTKYMKGHHVKDLARLNRDMSKVIFIDFDPKSFQLNPENVLRIPKWEGDMNDTSLVDLAELLKTIYLSDADDVRPTLQYYSQFDDPPKEFRRKAMLLAEQELAMKQYQTDAEHSALKRYSGRLFGFRRHG